MDDPNFVAGYYHGLTLLGFVIVLSVAYQTNQISMLLSNSKWPDLPDLPYTKEKDNYDDDDDDSNYKNSFTKLSGDTPAIHFKLTVWMYKMLNYVLDINLVGEISISEVILLMMFIVLNLTFLYLPFQDGVSTVPDLYNRSAYIALANAAFVFPLATRNSVFGVLFGIPFERLIAFHRWVGRMIFLLLTFHSSYQIQQNFNSLSLIFSDKINLWGFLAYVSLFIIIFTSHSLFRRHFFELFYWSHFSFIFFLIFGVLHNDSFSTFTCVGVGLYVIDRIIRFLIGYKNVKIISIETMKSNVTKVVFDFKYYYSAGQYMFINIPNLYQPKSLITWHPISFSSSKSIINGYEDGSGVDDDYDKASFHMKTQGGFSDRLYVRSQQQSLQPLKLKIDGPYGRPSVDFIKYNTVVLIGGGIGVTPIISILKDLISRQLTNIPIRTQSIHFFWTVPNLDSYSWFELELQDILVKSQALPRRKYLLDVRVFLTQASTLSTPRSSLFFTNRPNFNILLHEIKKYHGTGDIAVGVCGPAALRKQVRNASVIESDETCLFRVHHETFEL